MDKITTLRQDIAEMEEVYNDKGTAENIKSLLKPSIETAKKELAELESDKGSDVDKGKMTIIKTGKLEKPKAEKKEKKYKLGDLYSSDFDYDGMLRYALTVDENTSDKVLEKLFNSFEDVNYHTIAAPLYDAYKGAATKDLKKIYILKFKKLVKEELAESDMPEIKKTAKTPKTVSKGLSALQKCQDLLAKYTNEKKTEQERIDKRKASGKPAELTPAETIKKAAKVVGNKIKDIKETDKKLTKAEVTNIITGIEETIKNTISAIVEVEDREYFIEELINYLEELDKNFELQLQSLLGEQYAEFVQILGKNIKDKKFRKALFRIEKKNKINTKILSAKVYDMMPTQSEIDVEKSLIFPLTLPATTKIYLSQKTPIVVNGNPLVTCDNTKYIIDGHHRWSQIYVLNPEAIVSCLDLTDLKEPFEGLKASQLAVAIDSGKVPTANVQGKNLLKISEKDLKKYVNATLTPECREVFEDFNIMNPANHIWENVKLMQEHNVPIENAPSRNLMPQTDIAKNFENYIPNVNQISSTKFKHGGNVEEHNIDMLHSLGVQMKHHTHELMQNIHKNDDVEAWVVAKAERAATDLSDITHYLEGQKKKFDRGGLTDQYKDFHLVTVKFKDSKYNYQTVVNPKVSEQEVRRYFVGQMFNVGQYPKEIMLECIDIDFFPAPKSFANGGELDWGKELSGGYSVGDDVTIIDPTYREYYNKSGYLKDEVGSNFEVILSRNGQDYTLIVPKRGVKRLDMTNLYKQGAMAKGGVIYPNLSDMKPSVLNDAPTYEKLSKKKAKLEIGEYAIQEVDLVKIGEKITNNKKIIGSMDAVYIFRQFWHENSIDIRESAYAMFLDTANNVKGIFEVGKGAIGGVTVDPELIASVAVKSLARGVIVAHNHPSGNLRPSTADLDITKKLREGLKFLDIKLLDHIIITKNDYYSFEENGVLKLI